MTGVFYMDHFLDYKSHNGLTDASKYEAGFFFNNSYNVEATDPFDGE